MISIVIYSSFMGKVCCYLPKTATHLVWYSRIK